MQSYGKNVEVKFGKVLLSFFQDLIIDFIEKVVILQYSGMYVDGS